MCLWSYTKLYIQDWTGQRKVLMRMKKQKREFLYCLRHGDCKKGVLATSKELF